MINVGDIVISLSGRDAGEHFLVVKISEGLASIVNGKSRKVINPKRKNVKHLEQVKTSALKQLAERISSGEYVGNERVYKAIATKLEKI